MRVYRQHVEAVMATKRKSRSDVRVKVVWASLMASMCLGFAVLWALGGRERARLDGLTLPPMVAAAGPSSIESIFRTRAPLDTDRWRSIVIHASGSPVGSPTSLEAEHRTRNLRGLGYHFVIGNGRGFGDGEIYVGARWLDQIAGAHVAGPNADDLNVVSIGICLIGDGHREAFTEGQMRRLIQLVQTLSRELDISPEYVHLHSDVAEAADPGRFFPAAAFRQSLASGM